MRADYRRTKQHVSNWLRKKSVASRCRPPRRGAELFFSERGGCSACHSGPNFTDEQFHQVKTGLDESPPDLGRFAVTGQEADRGAFKTPTLRNVAQTGPYLHDGRFQTLAEAVAWFAPADLSAAERADLVEFLKSLSSDPPPIETGRLP